MTKSFVLQGASNEAFVPIDYAAALNEEQRNAVLNGDGISLVLAGAGSGKTRTITYRVAYLLEQGAMAERILLLTFTNKAAREMRERIEQLLGTSIDAIWSGTFHSIAHRFLRMYGDRIGINPSFSILDSDDAKSTMKLAIKDANMDGAAKRFPSPSVCLDIVSYGRNVCKQISEVLELRYPHFVELASGIEDVAHKYADRKQRANALDFDDLLAGFLSLVEHPDVGRMISERFQHVLVDEYQDTNAIQARIVQALARVHQNLFVVGDDAQSIYAFRGADVRNILDLPSIYPHAKVFTLVTNYRSTPQILDLANESLRHNEDQFHKDLVALRSAGEKPSLIPASSARQEAQYVAEQILALRHQGAKLGSIAVLFRATSHSQQLEMELLKRDLPYEYRGGLKLFERAHVKDVLSFLRVIHNVKHEQAWMRLLSMQEGIGATSAERVASEIVASDASIEDVIKIPPSSLRAKARIGWDQLCAVLQMALREAREPAHLIRGVANSPYQQHLEREYPNWRDRLEDIEQFASFAEQYQDLETFLGTVTLYDDTIAVKDRGASYQEDRMVLSTVHQAKGLEWDTVFVIHLADGSFPNRRALAEEGGLEEERRLFYVAVTRARVQLFLSYPLTVGGGESLMFNRASPFIDEIAPRLIDRVELLSARGGFGASSSSQPAPGRSWHWDGDFSDGEDVIEVDGDGNRRRTSPSAPTTKTVWKKK
ncbi:MAG: UvrD-helicase domain-containing protein [Candidatus Uhrbacteria bacterium]|nr:UvrD-helicase domain-containing protein [Candidatus Uhrbacteria bacterium]